ncbi:ArsC/Spx/MgsR family protein [Lactococcus garvieae]
MIILYYTLRNSSCVKTLEWFQYQEIEILKKRVELISRKDLLHALSLTEKGFTELLKNNKTSTPHLRKLINSINSMSFNDAVEFILEYPEVLKLPLIFSEKKLVIGYNSENIRIFVPHKNRIVK